MPKKMLINANAFGEARVAVIKNGLLEEINMESSGLDQIKGNIYGASVVHVDSGLEAAFINYGADRHGFIPLNEIPPIYFSQPETPQPGDKSKARIIKGTKLLLQVEREPMGYKGASFTGYISLPGRYLVIMPFSARGGVSRKIEDPSERERLKNLVKELEIPNNFGVIIRTAGLSVSVEELKKDYDELLQKWEAIQKNYELNNAPGLINADLDLVVRSVRDYFSTDFEEVLIDNREVYKSVQVFFEKSIPESVHLLKFYQEKELLFSRYGIEEQIEGIFSRIVPLPTGGSIIVDSTEALVAIDVNSGKGKGVSGQEKLSFEINTAAAAEVARQLRLRDLGGLIVIDFIDMKNAKHRSHVKKVLQEEMKKDKARVEIGNISKFGLLELSRQRVKMALHHSHSTPCSACQGSGLVKSVEFLAVNLLRKIFRLASRVPSGTCIKATGRKEIIEFLANEKRKEILRMESDFGISIHLLSDPQAISGQETLIPPLGEKEKIPEKPNRREGSTPENHQRMVSPKRSRRSSLSGKRSRKPQEIGPKEIKAEGISGSLPSMEKGEEKMEQGKESSVENTQRTENKPEDLKTGRRPRRRFYRKRGIKKENPGNTQNPNPEPGANSGGPAPASTGESKKPVDII